MLTQGTAPDCRHTRVFISPNNVNVFVSGLFAVIETGKNSKFHYTDLETGKFIDSLKLVKVIPIFKNKGSPFEVTNYRPISLLSNIDKLF